MNKTTRADMAYQTALRLTVQQRKEMLIPETVLWSIMQQSEGRSLIECYDGNVEALQRELLSVVAQLDEVPREDTDGEDGYYELMPSMQMTQLMRMSEAMAASAGKELEDIPHMLQAILELRESMASYLLQKYTTDDRAELLASIVEVYEGATEVTAETADDGQEAWRSLVICVNDLLEHHNPLIGREAELDRTIQVLCRKDKNNPLHVGEPGVGKTALVYGLAERIARGDVPDRLKGARIYQMDMGQMVAGTNYRGEFEKRIRAVMTGILAEGNAIVYIDEIHTLVGSGSSDGSALDGSNLLKPYLESGEVRFIGSTTYQEYNRYLQRSRGLVRRFQQIDIHEPSVEDAVGILKGLQTKYEEYHGVKYADGVIRYAVESSAKHISDRFLPDKAIDLIDEAGAYRELHPIMRKYRGEMRRAAHQWVDKALIDDVLARISKVDPKSLHDDDGKTMASLRERISSQIYGQNEAIAQVVQAVEMGKAGLLEEGKPVASLLFVGATGVGKTEVCKVLAKELGIELVRFDMSEYAEKHTVAKLIGSPAGYVGYEDGGLLTDAIRKTPHCVLLLDEIEKAHADIYNILLQVMDYARLTDNKGQHADFTHVILVMTSNAGAQYAHQASMGFGAQVATGEAMLGTVRKTFKPEFLARLSGMVAFRDMDEAMASRILDKKLGQLATRLAARRVTMTLSEVARGLLLQKGYNHRMGAREMDRQIARLLGPLLTHEMLYGSLRSGGHVMVDVAGDDALQLTV